MGSQGVLVLQALFFEMPEAGGLEVKLQVNKPADLVVKQVRLRINGDGFWSAVSDIVGKGVVSTVKLTVHPIVMGPDMLDTSQFKKGETACGVHIHLGSIGKFKAKKKTLVKKMTAISQKNDPEFILELEYGEKGFKWKTEGMLIALPVTCGKILKAAQGAYNYLDPPTESPQPVHAHATSEAQAEPVTPLKESKQNPLKDSESKKRKSLRTLRDELSPMKDSILNFMAPVSDLPNIIKNTLISPTKETHDEPNPENGEFTFFCTICKTHVAIENMDTHSSTCSTFDDSAKATMDFVHEMTLTCVICKQQIPVDMLDTHSISCYASQDLVVDRTNVKGKEKFSEPDIELSDEEVPSKREEEEEEDIPSYRKELTFHYDKFYGEESDNDSQDSYRDLYYSRDDFSKLNKEKEETVEKEDEVLDHSEPEQEDEPEKEYNSDEDRERAFSMLYEANFANKKDEPVDNKAENKDKKGIIKKLKDKANKEKEVVKEKKNKKETTDKKEKKEKDEDSTKPSKRKKVKNLAKQLVHL